MYQHQLSLLDEFWQASHRDSLQGAQVKFLHFFSCPGCPSQKLQAGLYAWVIGKTFDRDTPAHFLPAISFQQMDQYLFQGNPVQWIMRSSSRHQPSSFCYLVTREVVPVKQAA